MLPEGCSSTKACAILRHAFKLLYFAPHSTLADITCGGSTSLPLCYNVMTSLRGPFAGRSTPAVVRAFSLTLLGTWLRTNDPRERPFLCPRVEAASP